LREISEGRRPWLVRVVCFAALRAADLHEPTAAALDTTIEQYRLASLRYDLSKLRAKGLVERVPRSRRYRLLPQGYAICLLFLKLFERVYAPLTAGLLRPVTADARLAEERRQRLDRLYQRIAADLDALLMAVGLRAAA
jgi:DNA-binding transcriptional ArsR family regulator